MEKSKENSGNFTPAIGSPFYRMEGDCVWFGEYPQSLKKPDVRVTTEKDGRGYFLGTDGAYYAKVKATPCETIGEPKFGSGEKPQKGTVYYFKVEPIRWRVLSKSDATALLLCDSVLAPCVYRKELPINVLNDYARSGIRAWLNGKFWKTAFTQEERAAILTARVDNSEASTCDASNPYTCEDTKDKVFLLSCAEVTNKAYGFLTPEDLAKRPSDYAAATGAYMCRWGFGWWWLRSPHSDYHNYVRIVDYTGELHYSGVGDEHLGAVPALRIRL